MFNLFKPTKTYCVCWAGIDVVVRQDIVKAKNTAYAWQELKKAHPEATYCFSITKRNNKEHGT